MEARKIVLVAKSDRSMFVCSCVNDEAFVLISLMEPKEIDLGDQLLGHFDLSEAGQFQEVRNLTKENTVRIVVEEPEVTQEHGMRLLEKLGNPTSITIIKKTAEGLVPYTYDVVAH